MADEIQLPDDDQAKPAKSSDKKQGSDKESASKAIPLEDEFEELPPEAKRLMRSFMFSSSRYMGPVPNPIASKINEKHIDKILESSDKESDLAYKSGVNNKFFAAFIILVFVALFVFVTMYLSKDNRDLYMEILKLIVVFLGGFGGGYGVKSYVEKNKD